MYHHTGHCESILSILRGIIRLSQAVLGDIWWVLIQAYLYLHMSPRTVRKPLSHWLYSPLSGRACKLCALVEACIISQWTASIYKLDAFYKLSWLAESRLLRPSHWSQRIQNLEGSTVSSPIGCYSLFIGLCSRPVNSSYCHHGQQLSQNQERVQLFIEKLIYK